jgi:mRNA interferase YafQ
MRTRGKLLPTKTLRHTNLFKRELRRAAKRGARLDLLEAVVQRLVRGEPLDRRQRAHRLSGEFEQAWECHVTPDLLLIWREFEDEIVLERLGSHSDLFRK